MIIFLQYLSRKPTRLKVVRGEILNRPSPKGRRCANRRGDASRRSEGNPLAAVAHEYDATFPTPYFQELGGLESRNSILI